MAFECIVSKVVMLVTEYVHSTIFIGICIMNPIISVIYTIKYRESYSLFLQWMCVSLIAHFISYTIYITRPVTNHPHLVRRLVRCTLPCVVWRVVLCRCLFRCIQKRTVIFHMVHMINMIFFTLYFGIFILGKIQDKYSSDSILQVLVLFTILTSVFLALDILILEMVVVICLIPIFAICFIFYLFSLCLCPSLARSMNRTEAARMDQDNVDRDFFTNFRGGHNWQKMLLYIFKNNKIVFRKQDFEEHYKLNNDVSSSQMKSSTSIKHSKLEAKENDLSLNMEEKVHPENKSHSSEESKVIPGVHEKKLIRNPVTVDTPKQACLERDNSTSLKDEDNMPVSEKLRGLKIVNKIRTIKDIENPPVKQPLFLNHINIKKSRSKPETGIICSICQEDLIENEKVLQLECGNTHLFHFPCLKEWMKFKFECPTCRTNLQTLYEDKMRDQEQDIRLMNNRHEESNLYAEDMLQIQRARNYLLGEIEQMEEEGQE